MTNNIDIIVDMIKRMKGHEKMTIVKYDKGEAEYKIEVNTSEYIKRNVEL